MSTKQKIMTTLWFNGNAEEAINFYVSLFKNSRIHSVQYYGKSHKCGKEGEVMSIYYELEGQKYMAINGGPCFQLSEAVSLYVGCENQEEIDTLWEKFLTESGAKEQSCGWLKDKFGLSWQINWAGYEDLITNANAEQADKLMTALCGMKKVDIAGLQKAVE